MAAKHGSSRTVGAPAALAGVRRGALPGAVNPAMERPLAKRIETLFSRWADPAAPGIALGIMLRGRLEEVFCFGCADLVHGIPIRRNSAFDVASTSKQFTAACIAVLIRRGALSLDSVTQDMIPEMRMRTPIPIGALLYHTSGLPDYLLLHRLRGDGDHYTPRESLDMLAALTTLGSEPGARFSYSNSNYLLLGEIVSRVSAISLREFAQDEIFGPLSMLNTRFHDDHRVPVAGLATGYRRDGDGRYQPCMTSLEHVGDGGLHTTIEDLARWDANFYENRLNDGDPELLHLMLTPGSVIDRHVRYAFGLGVGSWRGLTTVSHAGAFEGYRAEYVRFPERDVSLALLSNDADADVDSLAFDVASFVFGDSIRPIATPADRAFAGRYRSPDLAVEYHLQSRRGLLVVRVGETKAELEYAAPDEYQLMGQDLFFSRSPDGNVSGFVIVTECGSHIRFDKVR